MSAEQLIALEAAVAELGALYQAAKIFAALRLRADAALLPQVLALGSRLRRLLRAKQLTPEEIDAAAREIAALRAEWRAALEQVRTSATYQQACAALAADRQDELARVIPQVLADIRAVSPAPTLYFPVSPSSGRRKPGTSPFLSAAECAARIGDVLAAGITPDDTGADWWEQELPSILCAEAPAALDTPIALRLDAAAVGVAVFGAHDEPQLRIFTPRLRAPMSIVLAAEATDEWWEAYEESYHAFRGALEQELQSRGLRVAVMDAPVSS